MTTEYKIKVTARGSMKRGSFLEILDGDTNKQIAYIGSKDRHIEDSLPAEQRAKVLMVFDNYETILEFFGSSCSLSKLNVQLPEQLSDALLNACKIADALDIDFHPMRKIIQALTKEITRVLHKAGKEVDLPQIQENTAPSKHVAGRKIFDALLKFNGKGGVETFRSIAEQSFKRDPDTIEVKHLHLYAEGKAKPSYWAYSAALEALAALGDNVFKIKLEPEALFDYWSTYYLHAGSDKDQVIALFEEKFKPTPDVTEKLKTYLSK